MDALSIAKRITQAVLVTLVLAVIGFSLLLAPDINASTVTFALGKGFLTFVFGWIFILILMDSMVKSIASSAMEARATRREGGMMYHFLKPDLNEVGEDGEMLSKKKEPSA
jgi:hypothetical protein